MSEKMKKATMRNIYSSEFLEGGKEGVIFSLSMGAIILVALKIVKQIVK